MTKYAIRHRRILKDLLDLYREIEEFEEKELKAFGYEILNNETIHRIKLVTMQFGHKLVVNGVIKDRPWKTLEDVYVYQSASGIATPLMSHITAQLSTNHKEVLGVVETLYMSVQQEAPYEKITYTEVLELLAGEQDLSLYLTHSNAGFRRIAESMLEGEQNEVSKI